MEKYRGLTRNSGKKRVWNGKINLDPVAADAPRKWKKARRVFVNSMSDLFHESVPSDFIALIWRTMQDTPQHTYQILTKRPGRMREVLSDTERFRVLDNVWLGTSVENSDYIHRLDELRLTNAKVRFVSFEPLIGSVREANLSGIDWAIVGGESGPSARPIAEDWVDEIREQCDNYDTSFFFKQWGGKNKKATGRTYRNRTWDEYPITPL